MSEQLSMKAMIKVLTLIMMIGISLTGCANNEKQDGNKIVEQPTNEIQTKKFPKASCILWIDKNKERTLLNKVVRNVKAKVLIDKLGKVSIIEYEKKPHFILKGKIDDCLKTYRVSPEQMKKGRLIEGENYVFLRFVEREL